MPNEQPCCRSLQFSGHCKMIYLAECIFCLWILVSFGLGDKNVNHTCGGIFFDGSSVSVDSEEPFPLIWLLNCTFCVSLYHCWISCCIKRYFCSWYQLLLASVLISKLEQDIHEDTKSKEESKKKEKTDHKRAPHWLHHGQGRRRPLPLLHHSQALHFLCLGKITCG